MSTRKNLTAAVPQAAYPAVHARIAHDAAQSVHAADAAGPEDKDGVTAVAQRFAVADQNAPAALAFVAADLAQHAAHQ